MTSMWQGLEKQIGTDHYQTKGAIRLSSQNCKGSSQELSRAVRIVTCYRVIRESTMKTSKGTKLTS